MAAADNQVWSQHSTGILGGAEEGDRFGSALAAGDFNDDDYDDLAVGVPLEDLEYDLVIVDAGVANVIYGTGIGLNAAGNQVWRQDSPGIIGFAAADDRFGSALAAGDFNGDRRDDLAIGVPGEDVFTGAGVRTDAGAVNVIYGRSYAVGLVAAGNQLWHQDVIGILDAAEDDDKFGSALTAGDFNDDGKDDLAIGVPGEDLLGAAVTDAGAVNVLYGRGPWAGLTALADQFWHQDLLPNNDGAEMHDRFGSALTAGDFNGDGKDDLAIGVPGEDIGECLDAGAVDAIYGQDPWVGLLPAGSQFWHQDRPGILDDAEQWDCFGQSLP